MGHMIPAGILAARIACTPGRIDPRPQHGWTCGSLRSYAPDQCIVNGPNNATLILPQHTKVLYSTYRPTRTTAIRCRCATRQCSTTTTPTPSTTTTSFYLPGCTWGNCTR